MTKQEIEWELALLRGWTIIDVPFVPRDVKAFADKVCFTQAARKQWYLQYPNSRIVQSVPPLTGEYAMELLKEMKGQVGYHLNAAGEYWEAGCCDAAYLYDAPTPEEAIALAYIAWKKSN